MHEAIITRSGSQTTGLG